MASRILNLPSRSLSRRSNFCKIGVKFIFNTRIGKDITVDDSFHKGFGAVFIGVGANVDAPLKAEGVTLKGIYQSGEYLLRTNPPRELVPNTLRDRLTWASVSPSSAAVTPRRIVCGLRFDWARRK